MFRFLFLLFIVIPIIEIAILIQVGSFLGFWPTVAIVIFTAWLGAKKVKEQGLATVASVQQKMAMGEMPSDEIVTGLMLIVSGVFLVTPGFVTDIFGLLLLVPKVRASIARFVNQHIVQVATIKTSHIQSSETESFYSASEQHHSNQHTTIEGEFERKD